MDQQSKLGQSVCRDEVFADGLTTYWMVADDQRAANDAVAEVARVAGPFEDYINVHLVSGRVEPAGNPDVDGWRFTPDEDGDVECWEVDAQ